MYDYQRSFIDFMLEVGVLTFGDFTTKSGRKTPYFVNTGKYRSGLQLAKLGRAYADAIERSFPEGFDVLFGPAYKGIPLVVAVAMAFAERGREVEFCFNRKETKDHGEGGTVEWAVAWSPAQVRFPQSVLAHVAPGGPSLKAALQKLADPPAVREAAPMGEKLLNQYLPGEAQHRAH